MKSINISQPVWEAIAALGKFGESEDDVLRRVFEIHGSADAPMDRQPQPASHRASHRSSGPRRSFATDRLSSYISGNELRLSFESGPSSSWTLPAKSDKAAIRVVRDQATSFAEKNRATLGQVNAVRKTLTDSGYFLTR